MTVKMTLTFNDETMETLRKKAKDEGFERPSSLARYLLIRSLKENKQAEITEDEQIIQVPVDNYRELQGYAEVRKFGNVAAFAVISMERFMKQNSLSEAQKRRVEAKYGINLLR